MTKKSSSSSLNNLAVDETNSWERFSVVYSNHLGLFLDQNKLLWMLIVDTGKHENILFLVDFHTGPLSECINATQAGNTEKISNVLPEFSSTKSPSLIYLKDNLTRWKSNKKPLIGLTAFLIISLHSPIICHCIFANLTIARSFNKSSLAAIIFIIFNNFILSSNFVTSSFTSFYCSFIKMLGGMNQSGASCSTLLSALKTLHLFIFCFFCLLSSY